MLISDSYAQSIDTSTYAKKVEYLFQYIEKPKNAGIWYNKVLPFAGLQVFGQNGRKGTSSYAHFKQAYFELL